MNDQDANNVSDHRFNRKSEGSASAEIDTARSRGEAAKNTSASRPPMPEPPQFPPVTASPTPAKDSASITPYDLDDQWSGKDNPWGGAHGPSATSANNTPPSATPAGPSAPTGPSAGAPAQPVRSGAPAQPPPPEPTRGFFGRRRAKKEKKHSQTSLPPRVQPGQLEPRTTTGGEAKKDTAPAGAAQSATKPHVGQPASSRPASAKPNIGQPPAGKPAGTNVGGAKTPGQPSKTTAPGGPVLRGRDSVKDGAKGAAKGGPKGGAKGATAAKTGGGAPAPATPQASPPAAAAATTAPGSPAGDATFDGGKKAAGVATAVKTAEPQTKRSRTEDGEGRKIFGIAVPDEAQRGRIARILLPLVIIIGGFLFFYFYDKPTPLPELAPVGTELPMEANFDGELKGDRTIRPYDSRLKRGIVPVWEFPGTMLGTTSDGQVLATAHDNMISGWSLHTGKELWTLPATNPPQWDNWNQPSARGMLPIDGTLVNLATGEQFPTPGLENAQYCSGTANPYIFLIGSELVGVNPAGQQIFRSPVDNRVGTPSTCHGFGAVVRVMPQSATAEAATHHALTGDMMELRGLTGAPGVIDVHFAEDGYIVVRPYVKDRNNWHAYNYQSERLFGNEMPRPGEMPLMFAGNSFGSIEPYRWAMKNELHRGYLIADGGELFAAGDANGDDPVDALMSVREEKGMVLRQSLPQNDPSHTLLVTEDHSTIIISPHDADPLNVNSEVEQEHYVAAYDVSSGEELWNYQIGEAEQLNLSQGILWASNPSGSITVFSPSERP
ncbi:MAG: hypothetical protein Q4P33_05860 [Flaviflexus sp.]|nr:hypothetical protein [Flaviflexus sp.]